MRRVVLALFTLGILATAHGQFVWPKKEYNQPKSGLYTEDPFIIEWRKKFFSVFRGDFKTFDKAFVDITAMVQANPRDARARVWLGNGQTVKAGLMRFRDGKSTEPLKLLEESRKNLDAAVSLSPKDPNIYMMRAATLYIQGQYFKPEELPRSVWETLRDDCLRFIAFIGPERMKGVSIHLRGEAYGELGIAYKMLGEKQKAIEAFRTVIRMNPSTGYETRARREIELLGGKA